MRSNANLCIFYDPEGKNDGLDGRRLVLTLLASIFYNSIAVEAWVFEMGFGVLTVIGEEFFYIRDVNDGN